MAGLLDVLIKRAEQMALPRKARIQPRDGASYLDTDYTKPAPQTELPDLSKVYPRNPDPAARLPKRDRARILVDRADEIALRLADRIRATGQLDEDTRLFYHTDGPLYRGARNAGLTHDEAMAYLVDLGYHVAATSPRTKVEDNLRNATLSMAKSAQGLGVRDVIGPGTVRPDGSKGISEKGYPMMTGKDGIHGKLLDNVRDTGGINTLTNPKPATFGANIAGNRSGVTVDTHAIRGTLQTLNELDPGSVPADFILPKFRKAYRADPTTLTPDMIDDTLASQKIGPRGDTVSMQTEYSVFADIWHKAADHLGVSPAEAQSMGWFGFGDDTNLGSERKTPVDTFNERLDVTAQALDEPVEATAGRVFRREIPLLGLGAGLLAAGAAPQTADAGTLPPDEVYDPTGPYGDYLRAGAPRASVAETSNTFGDVGSRLGNEALSAGLNYLSPGGASIADALYDNPSTVARLGMYPVDVLLGGLLAAQGGAEKLVGYGSEMAPGSSADERRLARDILGIGEALMGSPVGTLGRVRGLLD